MWSEIIGEYAVKERKIRAFDFFAPKETRAVIIANYPRRESDCGFIFYNEIQFIYANLLRLKLMGTPKKKSLVKWARQGILMINADGILPIIVNIIKFIKAPIFIWGRLELNCPQALHAKAPHEGWQCDHFCLVPIDWDTGLMRMYTDGACSDNGKKNAKAGWAVVIDHYMTRAYYGNLPHAQITFDEKISFDQSVNIPATNNRAEMFAILFALYKAHQEGCRALIITDSNFTINVLTKWLKSWDRNGVIDDKKNPDILRCFLSIWKKVEFQFIHQNSHTNESSQNADGNRLADEYAVKGKTADSALMKI